MKGERVWDEYGEGRQNSALSVLEKTTEYRQANCVWLQIKSHNPDELPLHKSEYFPYGNMCFRS